MVNAEPIDSFAALMSEIRAAGPSACVLTADEVEKLLVGWCGAIELAEASVDVLSFVRDVRISVERARRRERQAGP